MEQFDSSVEESSKVSKQQLRNDEQQCPSWAEELTEASVWMINQSINLYRAIVQRRALQCG